MGKEILAALCREPDFEPVGVVEKLSSETTIELPIGGGTVPQSDDPEELIARLKPDVVVDFTTAEWTPRIASAAPPNGARLVIGTTGLPGEFIEGLSGECHARGIGAF